MSKNQRAQEAYDAGETLKAAELFRDPAWQAAANFKSGNLDEAARYYGNGDSATAAFNLGNTLAKMQDYSGALAAYDSALERDPDHADAKKNKALIESLLEQKNQNNNEQNQQSSDDQQNQSGNENTNKQDSPSQNNTQSATESDDGQLDEKQDARHTHASDKEKTALEEHYQPTPEPSDQARASSEQNIEKATSENSDKPPTNEVTNATQFREDKLSEEERKQAEQNQALQQWLQKVPDDPSRLMRNKFEQQYRSRLTQPQSNVRRAPGDQKRW